MWDYFSITIRMTCTTKSPTRSRKMHVQTKEANKFLFMVFFSYILEGVVY